MTAVYSWARRKESKRDLVAHLIPTPIAEHRMTVCSLAIDGAQWQLLLPDEPVRRCGRCEETERSDWAQGKVA